MQTFVQLRIWIQHSISVFLSNGQTYRQQFGFSNTDATWITEMSVIICNTDITMPNSMYPSVHSVLFLF